MSETTEIVAPLVRALNQIPGCWAMRVNSGRRGNVRLAPEGTPDIIGRLWARYFEIECKVQGGKLSVAQEARMKNTIFDGGIAFVARDPGQGIKTLLDWPGGRK